MSSLIIAIRLDAGFLLHAVDPKSGTIQYPVRRASIPVYLFTFHVLLAKVLFCAYARYKKDLFESLVLQTKIRSPCLSLAVLERQPVLLSLP